MTNAASPPPTMHARHAVGSRSGRGHVTAVTCPRQDHEPHRNQLFYKDFSEFPDSLSTVFDNESGSVGGFCGLV